MEEKERLDRIDEVRSDEVQEVISHVPHWMIRYGISVIFGLIVMLLILSYVVKYPEMVSGQITLTTKTPSVELVSKTNGNIQKIHIKEGDHVEAGESLLSITNPISEESAKFLNQLSVLIDSGLVQNDFQSCYLEQDSMVFGSLQGEYETLVTNIQEVLQLRNDVYYQNQISNLKRQISHYQKLVNISSNQKKLIQQTINDSRDAYKSDQSLLQEGMISKREFQKRKQQYIQAENSLEDLKKSVVQNQITVASYQKQLSDLTFQFEEKERQIISKIRSSNQVIKSNLTSWRQDYVLTAPISGKVTFNDLYTTGSFVVAGKGLMSIIPESEDYIGLIELPVQGAGRVEVGQKVHIKLENYPHYEFGQLNAEVIEINEVPMVNEAQKAMTYLVKVKLLNGMTTNYKEELNYKPRMLGVAEIITEDLRLIERIFHQMRKVLDR